MQFQDRLTIRSMPPPVDDSEQAVNPQSQDLGIAEQPRPLGWLSLPAMRYPNEYVWLVLFSAMDVMLTWTILVREGSEVNPIAAMVIDHWGLPGAMAFKFSLMLVVVISCEVIGRRRDQLARNLAQVAIIISALPVMYSLGLLAAHAMSL